jgi:ribosomal protein S27E
MDITDAEFDVMCHTPDCGNTTILIRVLADAENPTVMCGVCSTIITDVTPV